MKRHFLIGFPGVALLALTVALLGEGTSVAAPQYVITCDTCHQMPPLDSPDGTRIPETGAFKGNHLTHAGTTANSCSKCHGNAAVTYPTGHRDKTIQVNDTINGVPAATYSRGFFNQTSVPPALLGTCSNVNCHFETPSPEWGSDQLAAPTSESCGTCHSSAPRSLGHDTHLTHYGSGFSTCAKCHPDHTSSPTPYRHATSVGGSIHITTGSYAGSNYNYLPSQNATRVVGTCSNVYCHSSGQNATGGPVGAGNFASPKWDVPATGDCGTCHATSTISTGSHQKHLAVSTDCSNCHVNATATSYAAATHVDGQIDVGLGGYDKAGTPGNGYGSCASATCHVSPYGSSPVQTPTWGNSAGCGACHNGVGAFAAFGGPSTGSHKAHMELIGAACNKCHLGAVANSNGGTSHINTTVEVDNDYTASPVQKHAPGTYTGTCLSASCHSSPYAAGSVESPVWGSKTGCASCHKDTGAFVANGAPDTGSHAKHMAIYDAACGKCHTGAISGVSGGLTHANTTVEVANGYSASPVPKHPIGTYTGTCSAASCHTDGNGTPVITPKWGFAGAAACAGCHGGAANVTPATAILNTGKHRSHMNNYTTLGRGNNLLCGECHAKTVSIASNTAITNPVNHLNNFKDYSGVKAGGSANYDTSSGVCANVYCHSSGQATPVFRDMTGSMTWKQTAKLDCNGCHGNEAGATWNGNIGAPNYGNKYDGTLATANSHKKHTADAGVTSTTGCARCHLTTVDRGIANKMRNYSSAHLNKDRDVAFQFGGSYTKESKTCTTYCHSNVQAPGGNAAATVYGSPAWGDAAMTCGSCHINYATLTETPEALQLGSHKRHAVDAGYACSTCHAAGHEATSHADGKIDVVFTGKANRPGLNPATGTTYSNAVNNKPGDGYGSCSNSACHGRLTRNWGINTTTPTCEKCHGSANTAITLGEFKDTSGTNNTQYAGTHVSHLAAKHGYSNPIGCNECHIVPATPDTFGHMSSLPAKINWGTIATANSQIPAPGVSAPMVPSYTGGTTRQCQNTYCHAGVRKSDGSASGGNPTPGWNDSSYLGGTGCGKCHAYPPAYPHTTSTNCNACHNHVDQSNVAFSDPSKHVNRTVEVTVDECLGCHSSVNACADNDPTCINKKLIGAHSAHTDADLFLAGKKLSAGDYIDPSWIYGIMYKKGFPKYACGFCHPMDSGTHKNGQVELDLDPTHSLSGTVKNKNKAGGPWIVTHNLGTSVVCNNVYCHSNGFVSDTTNEYAFQQTPDWYTVSPWAGTDKCSKCHGNSPNTGGKTGSPAHARHVVGNHYKDVFDGYSAKLLAAGTLDSGAVHGDPDTATTFNCNICHYDTVKMSNNDKGSVCSDCHRTAGSAPLKGTMDVYSSNTVHVNGDVDVVFMQPFNVRSKAQLRNDITAVQSLYTSWTRVKGYKTYSSYDIARHKPVYVGGTCSTVSCHNGTQMEWRTQGPLACAACHTGLTQ